jgi:Ribose 5-phosphate isomerase A (phosphoriboisomerase A)
MSVDRDQLKRAAALRAIEEVQDGMVVGLGTGSTAAHVVEGLAARVAGGLRVVGIPTSERTAAQARRLGIPIATFAEHQRLDLTIDGADEVQLGTLDLIKGLGGAKRLSPRPVTGWSSSSIKKSWSNGSASTARYRSKSPNSAGKPPPSHSPSSVVFPSGATRPTSSPTSLMAAISSLIAASDRSLIPAPRSGSSR